MRRTHVAGELQKGKSAVSSKNIPSDFAQSILATTKDDHEPPENPEGASTARELQASLSRLPEELLLYILQHLKDQKDDLARLCRVNRRCKRISQELLYGTVGGVRPHHGDAYAISRWPALARNVRMLVYAFTDSEDKKSEREAFLCVLKNGHDIRWITLGVDLAKTDDNDELASTRTTTAGWLRLFNQAIAPSLEPRNRFSKLTHLCIKARRLASRNFPIESLSSLFRLPSLLHLQLDGFHQTTPFKSWPISPSTSPIKELFLHRAMLDITALSHLVTSIHSLEHFEYNFHTAPWEPFAADSNPLSIFPEHSWSQLGTALQHHRTCLERLSLSDASDAEIVKTVYPEGHDFGVLGSLSNFDCLHSMACPLKIFVNVDTAGEGELLALLPPRLEAFSTIVREKEADEAAGHVALITSTRDAVKARGLEVSVYFQYIRKCQVRTSQRLSDAAKRAVETGVVLFFKGGEKDEQTWVQGRQNGEEEDEDGEEEDGSMDGEENVDDDIMDDGDEG
ncbi:hypothetical protein COCMIDRAFT_5593 [Bipolaris oryzae ATCC 44560]|uniref:F-box domain-containing protein n=1 Tax=Bipolaris oryzae ATCC 44560 TaxID=930090 RepID=W6Z5G4_COCMI|nr:uncharacterized protein COCMIDRAFT_5593 [Bipolaris oryzae ATCC 44560]EUC45195.1 hypothetical protein COCMIDRAFT_5593 [Bipolaris oryzae ATCC 44560]